MAQLLLAGGRSTTPKRYRAAIIGLGQIGNQFDDDPKRTAVWTHAGAYSSVPGVELIAGADPDETRLQRFMDRRKVQAGYQDYQEMLRMQAVDLLSICSPTELHYPMVLDAVRAGVKAIFCEKPLASTMEQGVTMVDACRAAGTVLAVNHTRRWESIYLRAKRLLDNGVIGRLEAVSGSYPGKVFTMGTHLFDLMRYYGGEVESLSAVAVGRTMPELNLAGHLLFRSGAQGSIICGWDRRNHIFELDLYGSLGRIRVSGDGAMLEHFRFEDSPRYSGYRELAVVDPEEDLEPQTAPFHAGRVDCPPEENRLIAAVQDLVRCAATGKTPACSGQDGLAALEIASAMVESARRHSERILLPNRNPKES